MRIEVTQNDIELGIRKDPCQCPIAYAVFRKTNTFCRVLNHSIRFYKNGKFLGKSRLPVFASRFVNAFDNGSPVEPLSFELAFELPIGDTDQ